MSHAVAVFVLSGPFGSTLFPIRTSFVKAFSDTMHLSTASRALISRSTSDAVRQRRIDSV